MDDKIPAWFPVLTTFLGLLAGFVLEWLRDRRASTRERQARVAAQHEKRSESQIDFQRQTLLDLQEATLDLGRTVGAMHAKDTQQYHATGKWPVHGTEYLLSEANRLANARTTLLKVRVRDESIRNLVDMMKLNASNAILSTSLQESDRAFFSMGRAFEQLNDRIGIVLRTLDE